MAKTVFFVSFWVIAAFFIAHAYFLQKKKTSIIDYFLAGGNLKLGSYAASLASTNLSLGNFIFVAAIWGYFYGFSALFWMFIGAILLATGFIVYAPHLKGFFENTKNTGTVHEYLAQKYSRDDSDPYKVRIRLFASVATIITLVFATALELHLGALIASGVIGGEPFLWFTALLACTATYTAFGGYRAVIFTDILQGGVLVLGSLVVVYLLFFHLNLSMPLNLLTEKYPTDAKSIFYNFEWHNIISFCVISFGWFLVTMDTWQRNSATRSIETSKVGIISGTIFLFIFMTIFALIGMYDFAFILPNFENSGNLEHSGGLNPINDLLTFSNSGTGFDQMLFGFLGISFVFAALSTADTFLNVCSYSFTGDIIVGIKGHKELGSLTEEEDKKFKAIGMRAVAVLGILVLLVWLATNYLGLLGDPLALFFIAYSTQFSLLAPVLFSIKKNVAHPIVALSSIILGMISTLAIGGFSAYMLNNEIPGALNLRADQWLALAPVIGVVAGVLPFIVSLIKK